MKPLLAQRAMLVFVPYLLLVVAAGVRQLCQWKVVAAPLMVALAGFFAWSIWHFHKMPTTPRDYAGIAQQLRGHLAPNDVIFASRAWYATPLFYYVDPSRLVGRNYSTVLAEHPKARVWVIAYRKTPVEEEIRAALEDFAVTDEVDALRVHGFLYTRRSGSTQ